MYISEALLIGILFCCDHYHQGDTSNKIKTEQKWYLMRKTSYKSPQKKQKTSRITSTTPKTTAKKGELKNK